LNNFGLLKNPYFRKLWEKNTAEEQRKWESLHRKQPYIPKEGREDVMKLRLAKLDIAMTVNESGDESNDDDDPSIPTTAASPWIPFRRRTRKSWHVVASQSKHNVSE
jgi:hypothetical protein